MNTWVIGETLRTKTFCGSSTCNQIAEHPAAINSSGPIDAIIDLSYDGSDERKKELLSLNSELVFINDVVHPLSASDLQIVRFNGWNSFLENDIIEAFVIDDKLKINAQKVFALFNKKLKWVANIAGFISPRIIATVINEVYYTLGESIATKEAIDTAMLYGTNYPHGPFEWGRQIGIDNVYRLLKKLSDENSLYDPATSLISEVSID